MSGMNIQTRALNLFFPNWFALFELMCSNVLLSNFQHPIVEFFLGARDEWFEERWQRGYIPPILYTRPITNQFPSRPKSSHSIHFLFLHFKPEIQIFSTRFWVENTCIISLQRYLQVPNYQHGNAGRLEKNDTPQVCDCLVSIL